jgi:16S rRNA (uracil1498-N3)-methyltransferase
METKRRLLIPKLPQAGVEVELEEKEAEHAVRVLRLREGDPVEALDGSGRSVVARLRIRGGSPRLEFDHEVEAAAEILEIVPIQLQVAVLKGEAMEWVVEKAVELGVASLDPILTAHTVVQTKGKGPEAFQARWQKIADQALKQCGRRSRMEVLLPRTLELPEPPAGVGAGPLLWFDEAQMDPNFSLEGWLRQQSSADLRKSGLRLRIGPEGGWSERERGHLANGEGIRLGLGPLVLRAETASLIAVAQAAAALRLAF